MDRYCDNPLVLCEAWAHRGHPKSAQKDKVIADGFKLLYLRQLLSDQARLILAFGDQEAATHFQAGSWVAQALQAWGIEVHVVSLSEDMRGRIRDAQRRQRR